jgi:hypothetical protein
MLNLSLANQMALCRIFNLEANYLQGMDQAVECSKTLMTHMQLIKQSANTATSRLLKLLDILLMLCNSSWEQLSCCIIKDLI